MCCFHAIGALWTTSPFMMGHLLDLINNLLGVSHCFLNLLMKKKL